MITIQVKKRLNEQEHNQLYSLLFNSYGIQKKNKSKTIGVVHIHNILNSNIS